MKRILVAFAEGGHAKQLIRLIDLLGNKYSYSYAITFDDNTSKSKIKKKGPVFYVKRTREINENMLTAIIKQIKAMPRAINVILNSKADVILAAGSGMSAPLCFAAKILGKKVIFLESWSRVYHKSTSGKFVYKFADLFLVQHKEMLELYPKAIYAGCLS